MKYVFILNIFTLKNINVLCKKIDIICKNKNIDYVIECNNDEVSTEDIVKKYKRKKVILLPVGGDGMINRVINVMDFNNNLLFPIPYGTGNDFCRSLRREFNDGIHLVDLVKINNKYFINTACFGIDSFIANSSIIRNKYIPKKFRYIISSIISLFKYKMIDYKLYINDEIISGTKSTIAICNGMYYGGGFKIAPNSRLDDGKLDVYIADKMSKLKMLILMMGINSGKLENNKNIRIIKSKSLVIKCLNKIDANIDGECLSGKEFNVELLDKKIQLFYDSSFVDLIIR